MKYGYACVDPSFFMDFQQNMPQQKELLRAGVKMEHLIIEDMNPRHPDHPARRLLLRRLKAGDELVCYSQRDLGETAEERWNCLNCLSGRHVAIRMLHMTYEPDKAAATITFSSLRDAVREGCFALCSRHELSPEMKKL